MPDTSTLIVWKGSSALQLSPDSPEIKVTKDGTETTLIYTGPTAAVIAAIPPRLASIGTYLGFVDTVTTKQLPGGRSSMTVVLTPSPWTLSNDTPTIEIEWVEIQKKLETHPRYQTGGESELDNADLDQLDRWRNASSSTQRAAEYATIAASYPELKNLVDKLRRGQDSYMVYAPVVRKITSNTSEPTTNQCGLRTTPAATITGYEFLQTADRATRKNGRWERTEEWTGAEVWDSDIYPAS